MTTSTSTAEHTTQATDRMATQILGLVELLAPVAGPNAQQGTEALLAALARRVGPMNYAYLLSSMCLSKSR